MAQGLTYRNRRRQPNSDREFRAAFRSGLLAAIDGLKSGLDVPDLERWYRDLCGFAPFRNGKPQPPRVRPAVGR